MGEVQDRVGKNGKGSDGSHARAQAGNKEDEENEVARGVIRRLQGSKRKSGREEAARELHDEELDVPNLEVPDSQ